MMPVARQCPWQKLVRLKEQQYWAERALWYASWCRAAGWNKAARRWLEDALLLHAAQRAVVAELHELGYEVFGDAA